MWAARLGSDTRVQTAAAACLASAATGAPNRGCQPLAAVPSAGGLAGRCKAAWPGPLLHCLGTMGGVGLGVFARPHDRHVPSVGLRFTLSATSLFFCTILVPINQKQLNLTFERMY